MLKIKIMRRVKCGWRKLIVGFVIVSGILMMNSCNNQVCPAYSKAGKTSSIKNV
jgi:hypothetical protein